MTTLPLVWPPAYSIKENVRSRHVKIKASVKHGLELIVPKRFNQRDIPHILEKNRGWIEKQLMKLQEKKAIPQNEILPSTIELPALQQAWQVQYIQTLDLKLNLIARPHQEIVLMGNIKNKSLCKKILTAWVREHACQYLLKLLQDISHEIKLPYTSAAVRNQTTRWGSCNSKKSISLNFKLIFFPPHLARHILIHELCHTVHLNHGEQFWQLVERFDANWAEHDRLIRKADEWIPWWVV